MTPKGLHLQEVLKLVFRLVEFLIYDLEDQYQDVCIAKDFKALCKLIWISASVKFQKCKCINVVAIIFFSKQWSVVPYIFSFRLSNFV